MSSGSQTQPREGGGFGVRFAVIMAAVTVVVAVALTPLWGPIGLMFMQAQLHAPDWGLLATLSPAIKIHLGAAVAALALGGILMAVRKGRRFHRVAGWVWVSLVAMTAGSTLFITSLNPGKWSLLHLFTGWTLIVLPLAVMWARRHNVVRHRRHMMGLFYGGFAINLGFAFIPGRTMWELFFG